MESSADISLLFWNIHKNSAIYPLIGSAIKEFGVDICILAEVPEDSEALLTKDLPFGYKPHMLSTPHPKVHYFYGNKVAMWTLGESACHRGSMLKVEVAHEKVVNLVGCHLIDPVNNDEIKQHSAALLFSHFIKELEEKSQNYKTVVIGDFNMNPFHRGMIDPECFNAVMCRNVASKGTCISRFVEYRFFYNPMWYYFGHPIHQNGTIFHPPYYWNLYDQVLIRPELINGFSNKELKIIDKINGIPLLTKDKKVDRTFSDHLPIYVKIKI